MRKLFVFNMTSLDGYFEGPERDISWHRVDAEFNEYAIAMLNSVDLLLFGRVTYELMARHWPTPEVMKNDPLVAERMNNLWKVVFSRTLDRVSWHNTRLVKENIEEEIIKMKKQAGKDMALLGSGGVMTEFAQRGLIDEYRIMVNPVVLGSGNPLFKDIKEKLNLELVDTRTFGNGNVLLSYRPVKGERA
jgi:dihydrofolate reductase